MANTENDFSPQQSILLIQSMIDKAKDNISSNRFYFLLWGWLTLAAITGQFLLKVVFNYEKHYNAWLLVIAGAVISSIYSARKEKRKTVKTYVEASMGHLWMGMGISFFILSLLFIKIGWWNCYPFYILLYGLGTFVSGRILNFRPMVIGGVINWILAAIAIRFDFDYQMLFAAAAIVTSYLIPGYMLKSK